MAITDPRLLPIGIRIDIDNYVTNFPELGLDSVMEMIKERLKCDFTFTKEQLKLYIDEMMTNKKSEIQLPVVLEQSNKQIERELDNSPVVDFQNNAAILEYFKKEAFERMELMKKTQTDKELIIIELEAISMKYMVIISNVIEKQTKLKLNFQDSNKYQSYLKDRIDTLYLLMKSTLKETVSDEVYGNIINKMQEKLKLYKW